MAHQRELITNAVVALLVSASTAAGSRVTATRVDPHKKGAIPALSVYALNDPQNDAGSSEMEEGHAFTLEVVGWATPTAINNLAAQVETAMRADPYFGGLASDSILKGTVIEIVEDNGGSDPLVGIAVLSYSVTYHIALAAT